MPRNDKRCLNCKSRCQSVFASAANLELDKTDKVKKSRTIKAHEQIHMESDGQRSVFCIERGHIKVDLMVGSKEARAVQICGPGEILGYGDRSLGEKYSYTALNDCQGCFFELETFKCLYSTSQNISQQLISNLSRTIAERDTKIAVLESRSVKARVAGAIFSLQEKFGAPSIFGIEIAAPLDRQTLADLSGTVTETLSRVLTELESEGMIHREGRAIHVIKPHELLRASAA